MPSPKFESNPKNTTTINKIPPCERRKSHSTEDAANYIDLPPDSFWVSKGDEHDWFDRNAIVKRTPSRKLSFSGCPTNHFNQENLTPHRSSLSFDYKSRKPPFIGLPLGHQKPSFPGGHNRPKKAAGGGVYFLRSRSEPGGKLAVTEPDSPQVNCLGRVATKKDKVIIKKTGFWQSIATVLKTGFRSHFISSPVGNCNVEVNKERTGPVGEKCPVEVKSQQPSLAGLMGLTSGRRSSGIIELKSE
ncbi:hypothetical protein LIER_13608 [Lithospermum erythrorhizon]|uniref:Uncharacterized protein n=1 Tax=Lithospermum erythrorhizon TaxID=34254 RepID=A0AAV3PXP3_LITER